MKILAIRGKNLASLAEEFAIDFTLEPLRSAGIFAITGPTGSGKSTLLDALCLALYNNTPRVSRDSVESLPLRDGGDKYISQKDPRNVLRRNAIEGYAQVDFCALDGKRYRSTWFVRRAYNKADGNLREATMQLENLENSSIEQDGKTAVLERVVSLIGLTFEQFTRTVLLAQGDFATFLKARQGEKAELLEKLTGTEIYSRISKRIYEQTKMASESLALIEEKLKGVHPLTKEEYSQKQTEKEKGKEEEEALKLIKYDVERHLRWL
ncbi:MAG: AAA family ATPase, partial [Bacteroidales bacterium]